MKAIWICLFLFIFAKLMSPQSDLQKPRILLETKLPFLNAKKNCRLTYYRLLKNAISLFLAAKILQHHLSKEQYWQRGNG